MSNVLLSRQVSAVIQCCMLDPTGCEILQATVIQYNLNMKLFPLHKQGSSGASCQSTKLQKVSQCQYLILRNQQPHKKFISVHSLDLEERTSQEILSVLWVLMKSMLF